jgi:hypothetical protein
VAALDAWAAQGSGGRIALFRETSAQTFMNTGSFVTQADAEAAAAAGAWEYPCAPMTPGTFEHNTVAQRNAVADASLAREVHVRRLPFYNLTAAHAAQYIGRRCQFKSPHCIVRHAANETQLAAEARCRRDAKPFVPCADCTHLCWTPLLYARLAHDLAVVCHEAATARGASSGAGRQLTT